MRPKPAIPSVCSDKPTSGFIKDRLFQLPALIAAVAGPSLRAHASRSASVCSATSRMQ